MDPLVIVDAIAQCMSVEEKEICLVGNFAILHMIKTAASVLGSYNRAADLPLFGYLSERICACCYDRAWYAKYGGCTAIKHLMNTMPMKWLLEQQYSFLRALLFVIMDLTNEVSSGAIDLAKDILEELVSKCSSPLIVNGNITQQQQQKMEEIQRASTKSVLNELVREVTSPNRLVREQAVSLLRILGRNHVGHGGDEMAGVSAVVTPHRRVLVDTVPPRKHLLRHQPVNTQIGLMDGNTFCYSLEPRLFSLNLSYKEHKVFFTELFNICEADDAGLRKLACYKHVEDLTPLRVSAMSTLSVLHYIPAVKERIINTLFKQLGSDSKELMQTAEKCIKQFLRGTEAGETPIETDVVHHAMRPTLLKMGDYRNLTLTVVHHLAALSRLFPNTFNEKLCEQLFAHLNKWLETALQKQALANSSAVVAAASNQSSAGSGAGGSNATNQQLSDQRADVSRELELCAAILEIFHLIPLSPTTLLEPLIVLVVKTETRLMLEVGSPLRVPLFSFLNQHCETAIEIFLKENRAPDRHWSRMLVAFLQQENAGEFRAAMEKKMDVLMRLCFTGKPPEQIALNKQASELQYLGIRIVWILTKHKNSFLATNHALFTAILNIWTNPAYHEKFDKAETGMKAPVDEGRLLCKCLLQYAISEPTMVDLQFHLLRAFTHRNLADFHFLRKWFDVDLPNKYNVQQKRMIFCKFVDLYQRPTLSPYLKSLVIKHILIPVFKHAFDNKEGQQLILGASDPNNENAPDCISVLIERVIDTKTNKGERERDVHNIHNKSDALLVQLFRFFSLLVEKAPEHIEDAATKKHGSKLRRIITFAWPCLVPRNAVDPASKYHGHLLLAHIIARFSLSKRIVLQTFYSLLKAHTHEARSIVRQALDVILPSMPNRMEGGKAFIHWTKKILVEEGHTISQLMHVLQLIVRHQKVYYPANASLVQQMVASMQRLGLAPNTNREQRRLAVDVAEALIKWEMRRFQESTQPSSSSVQPTTSSAVPTPNEAEVKMEVEPPLQQQPSTSGIQQVDKQVTASQQQQSAGGVGIERKHRATVVNFLMCMACQVNETSAGVAAGDQTSRRCIQLLCTALRPEIWPDTELNLSWLDKILSGADAQQTNNHGSVCIALEVLSKVLGIVPKATVVAVLKSLQRGLSVCAFCYATKIVNSMQTVLVRIFSMHPNAVAPKIPKDDAPNCGVIAGMDKELEQLFIAVKRVIDDGLSAYDKPNAPVTKLVPALKTLKSACTHIPTYIDSVLMIYVRCFQKLVKEHLQPAPPSGQNIPDNSQLLSEMTILCLELVKDRICSMTHDTRRTFIHSSIVQIIEKSNDVELMKTVINVVGEWLKTPNVNGEGLIVREKSLILTKFMNINTRFPHNPELHYGFLGLVNYIYKDKSSSTVELTSKLESAFLSGLSCSQPETRKMFFQVFNESVPRSLYHRLIYIACMQNWELMETHYWIKTCLEFVMNVAVGDSNVMGSGAGPAVLPAATSVINNAPVQQRLAFQQLKQIKNEPMDVTMSTTDEDLERAMKLCTEWKLNISHPKPSATSRKMSKKALKEMETTSKNKDEGGDGGDSKVITQPPQALEVILAQHQTFLRQQSQLKISQFLQSVANLCHSDTNLSHQLWCRLFPTIWSTFQYDQHETLAKELSAFVVSGVHACQRDCHPSPVHTIVESFTHCTPPIQLKAPILMYLGKERNLWFRCTLKLEQMLAKCPDVEPSMYENNDGNLMYTKRYQIMDSLSSLYTDLREEDMWAGLWQKRCCSPNTAKAIGLEQQGFFKQAKQEYENLMLEVRDEYADGELPYKYNSECKVWQDHWIRCTKELNKWEEIFTFANSPHVSDPFLLLDTAWKVPDSWHVMKEALSNVEKSYPHEMKWKIQMYKGYLAICHPDEQHLTIVERLVDSASGEVIKQWKRIPQIVSHIHTPLLQAAQQIIELQEAAQLHTSLQQGQVGKNNALHDMKAIVKTWRNRIPMSSDDLSHWSDVFSWRHCHYQEIVQVYSNNIQSNQESVAMLGVHASASAIINYGKIARKHGLVNSALDSLSRIHNIPSVPIVDCFQKIKQQVKCYLQMVPALTPNGSMQVGPNQQQFMQVSLEKEQLMKGVDVLDSTNLNYFTSELTAEFYGLKGFFFSKVGMVDDAQKSFSASIQLDDGKIRAWAHWGDFLESVFLQHTNQPSSVEQAGAAAISAFLAACRHQNEHKSRKFLSKVIWLLSFDDASCSLAEAIDRFSLGVPPVQWLAWVPQLLTYLVCTHGAKILNLLSNVARVFPQAVYFPIRTLYLTLKIEQRERYKSNEVNNIQTPNNNGSRSRSSTNSSTSEGGDEQKPQQQQQGGGESGPIRATPSMWRCSRIMHMQRDNHPTLLSSLEGIVDQMVWFRENWNEEVLRQLCQALAKCYTVAFENRHAISDASITPHTQNFVRKLVSTFGVGIENGASSVSQGSTPSAACESLARRVQLTAQDPVFQKMKNQFTSDFDFSQPGSKKLRNVIQKLKKWIRILEAKTKVKPKSFLIEEKCRFLSNFSSKTADVEIPGEYLVPKMTSYYVKITRFMPRVSVVQKHDTAARRLNIRGHNGKIYPYLVLNDACLIESRREERVLQLLRLLNPSLEKRKETARRQLLFTVPRVVAVSPQMRLVEDNPSLISLLGIFKKRCAKMNKEYDAPLNHYYERVAVIQERGNQVNDDYLQEIVRHIQLYHVPRSMLRDWAVKTFLDATDYWTFRKSFTLHLALLCFAEFTLHLTSLRPEMIQIAQDSGHLYAAYFRFNINNTSGELTSTNPVPFRLTPNIVEFITSIGVNSMLKASVVATARCFMQPNFYIESLLRAVLRDEMIAWYKNKDDNGAATSTTTTNNQPSDIENERLVKLVQDAVGLIMERIKLIAQMEGDNDHIATLIENAKALKNICFMDPTWFPWL